MWVMLLLGAVGSALGVEHAFTSMNSMATLVDTEDRMIQTLGSIIALEETRLAELKRYESYFKAAHEKITEDVMDYVTNPINSYQLMKRLTADWYALEAIIMRPVPNMTEVRLHLDLPVYWDLQGAAEALCRLQDTYKLNATDVAKGVIRGKQYSDPMTAQDAWELGRQMYSVSDFYHAVMWFKVALELTDQEVGTNPLQVTSRAVIADHMAYSMYRLGNIRGAVHWVDEYLKLEPLCERNAINKELYYKQLSSMGEEITVNEDEKPETMYWDKKVQLSYEKLCRGEVEVRHDLVCRYVDNGHPWLFLGKIKMEEMNLEPPIVVYHDVIFDSEIEEVKRLAKPVIVRSMVTNFSPNSTGQWFDRSRVSQTAFLDGAIYRVINTLDIRASILAGLNYESAEMLQVLNYGIGGHYEPHFDFALPGTEGFPNYVGNRIATLLFYMSDVEQGGATVFPDVGAAIFPRKGSAVLWYNLLRDGTGDTRTRHGACPVLIGSKWACNKWFHEGMQEFLRPCLLEEDSKKFNLPVVTSNYGSNNNVEATSTEEMTYTQIVNAVNSVTDLNIDVNNIEFVDTTNENYNQASDTGNVCSTTAENCGENTNENFESVYPNDDLVYTSYHEEDTGNVCSTTAENCGEYTDESFERVYPNDDLAYTNYHVEDNTFGEYITNEDQQYDESV